MAEPSSCRGGPEKDIRHKEEGKKIGGKKGMIR